MIGLFARRFSVLAAGAALVAAVAVAPVAADAAGLIAGPQPSERVTPVLASKPDLQVTANGAQADADGNTVYQFTITNVGSGPATDVKVTRLSQTREIAAPHKVRNTITVLEYDSIRAGQEKAVTVLCEKSAQYTCTYASVDVDVQDPEASDANNYAAQGA
jgi:hypothetical protein